jgi:hypothetical protein
MTREEAISYLGEDWEETFEDEIFKLKKQILSLLPVDKLYHTKLSKWAKLEQAYLLLGGEIREVNCNVQINITFSDQISRSYSLYQENHNILKLKLLNTLSLSNAVIILRELILLEKGFAFLWVSIQVDESVILSKIPDPMEILNGIKEFEFAGGKTFDDLKVMSKEVPEILKREQKRLTLYYTKYGKNE